MIKVLSIKILYSTLLIIITLSCSNLFAQSTGTGIFFQAIARDQYTNPAKDRKIFVQSSIVQSTATGIKVLIEEHQTTTDGSGVFSISVGQGTRIGGTVASLDKIEWAKGPYYLNLKIAITPMAPVANWDYTKDWIDLGTSPFGTVPYALYAGSSGALDSKLSIADTTKMLSIYAKAVNVNEIANQVKTKLSVEDTTTMLAPYARMVNELIATNITSLTAETINAALDAKLNLADSLTQYVTPTQLNSKTFDSTAIYNQLALKANTAEINSSISLKANNTDVNINLALKENISNKTIDIIVDGGTDTKYPSAKAVKDYVDTEIAGVTILDGSITDAKIIGLSGAKITGNIAGNSGTATKIATPVTINGVSFDGSSNITIDASPLVGSSSLTTLGTIQTGIWSGTAISNNKLANSAITIGSTNIALGTTTNTLSGLTTVTSNRFIGDLTGNVAGNIIGNLSGNASTATKLATPVTINGVNFDGASNISFSTNTVNALSFNNTGTGDLTGTTFNGSAAKTISYNTIGAAPSIGSASITTLGTISTGTWNASIISVAKGGTGASTLAANGVLVGNGTSTISTVVPSSNGNVLTSNGTTWVSSTPAVTVIREIADEFSATSSQITFTLSQTPSANSKIKMYINGVRISNSAYSITGTTITYNATNNGAYYLTANDRIQFDYYY